MNEEPYRWLEAIRNRREYILDQIEGARPVLAVSLEAGIVLFSGSSQKRQRKIYEVYDRLGLGLLGNPVDIEKVRQVLIEAAHLEGFQRSPDDVTLHRLLSYSLGPQLKSAFEQIFSPPLMVCGLLAEVGESLEGDSLAGFRFDGRFEMAEGRALTITAGESDQVEPEASDWIARYVARDTEPRVALAALAHLWLELARTGAVPTDGPSHEAIQADGVTYEAALLRRLHLGGNCFASMPVSVPS